jgi:hypothetical protein
MQEYSTSKILKIRAWIGGKERVSGRNVWGLEVFLSSLHVQ